MPAWLRYALLLLRGTVGFFASIGAAAHPLKSVVASAWNKVSPFANPARRAAPTELPLVVLLPEEALSSSLVAPRDIALTGRLSNSELATRLTRLVCRITGP